MDMCLRGVVKEENGHMWANDVHCMYTRLHGTVGFTSYYSIWNEATVSWAWMIGHIHPIQVDNERSATPRAIGLGYTQIIPTIVCLSPPAPQLVYLVLSIPCRRRCRRGYDMCSAIRRCHTDHDIRSLSFLLLPQLEPQC